MTKNTLGVFSFLVLFLIIIIGGIYFTKQDKYPLQDSTCADNEQKYSRELFYKKHSQKNCTENKSDLCLELTSRYELAKKNADPYKNECLDIWNQNIEEIDRNNILKDYREFKD